MNLRRTLATAAVAAVTAPAVLLSASTAFAGTKAPAQTQQKPTYAELKKAADDAKKAYEDAVAAEKAGREKIKTTMEALDQDSHPLKAAYLAADKAAKAAAADKTAADKAVTDARAALDEATDEDGKAKAQEALSAAEAQARAAADAKANADAKRKVAGDAWSDAQVAAFREWNKVLTASAEARKTKDAADRALAAAADCVRVPGLTVLANRLPAKVVAGTTVDFSFTVANATDRTLDVDPLVFFQLKAKVQEQHFMKVQWADGSGWRELDLVEGPSHIASVKSMKPGARTEVKMRMTLEKGAPAIGAFALLAGDASDAYNPCVLGPMNRYEFKVLPAGSKPGTVGEAKPGKVQDKDRPKSTPKSKPAAQTGSPASAGSTASAQPASAVTGGSLASTGASPAVPQLALVGGGAVLLGTGAVFAVRRHRGARGTN
ncbi:hypothetical protein RM550_20230 [Streptomyces sp. DSM 41527]|uniref:LPXTG cell wall anchor domain-containing protein n=1 Tax=Streptomyces mooreae TaxID=3075523 RepID=A0ABU2TAT0_9ACTN|nr:hypothetical protein [Streptomyces sp. DSM 41527]MDT0458040.1 hypothetical protein [Streptomyces sp. DSM 41527]